MAVQQNKVTRSKRDNGERTTRCRVPLWLLIQHPVSGIVATM